MHGLPIWKEADAVQKPEVVLLEADFRHYSMRGVGSHRLPSKTHGSLTLQVDLAS
jgi:hypothetical protein